VPTPDRSPRRRETVSGSASPSSALLSEVVTDADSDFAMRHNTAVLRTHAAPSRHFCTAHPGGMSRHAPPQMVVQDVVVAYRKTGRSANGRSSRGGVSGAGRWLRTFWRGARPPAGRARARV